MPSSTPEEQGIRQPYVLRVGVTHPALGGVDRESDRGAIADTDFYDLQNVRRRGKRWIARPGQVKVNTTVIPNPITGLFDLTKPGTVSGGFGGGGAGTVLGSTGPVIIGGDGVLFSSTSNFQTPLLVYDGQTGTMFGLIDQYVTPPPAGPMQMWMSAPFVLSSGQLGKIGFFGNSPSTSPYGTYFDFYSASRGPFPLAPAAFGTNVGVAQYSLLGRFPLPFPGLSFTGLARVGLPHTIKGLGGVIQFAGKTLFQLSNDVVNNYFFSFDGTTVTPEFQVNSNINGNAFMFLPVVFRESTLWFPVSSSLGGGFSNGAINSFLRDASGNYSSLSLTSATTNSTLIPNNGLIDRIDGFTASAAIVFTVNGVDTLFVGGQAKNVFQTGTAYGPRAIILTWDGASLKPVRVLETGGTPGGAGAINISAFLVNPYDKKLYYGWSNSDSVTAFQCKIGTYDGTTYTDSVVDLRALPGVTVPDQITGLLLYRGRIFAVIDSGSNHPQIISVDTALAHAWVLEMGTNLTYDTPIFNVVF